jgi:hypothetical protein
MTARKVVDEHGPDHVTLLFADVKGNNDNEHLGEDEDTYRFIADSTFELGARLVTLNEGRSIWQVFKDDRFLGNSRLANCSKFLKQQPCRDWLLANCDPDTTTVYVGISWDEVHRLPAIERAYEAIGFKAKAPLCDPPYMDKQQMLDACRAAGLEPPRAYTLGFPHNNCFAPETRIITSDGVKPLSDLVGQTVQVLGSGGGWRDANIKSFGVQTMSAINLSRYTDNKRVEATADHLWPVRKSAGRSDYTWKPTADLKPGDRIAGMYGSVRHNVQPSAIGVAAGFTFGDGTASKPSNGQITPAKAFLCGPKDLALAPYFVSCRQKIRSNDVIEILDLPRSWKAHPDLSESQSYLYGWLSGYFAADGTFTGGQARMSSAARENLELVRDVCARIGIATNPIRVERRLGYGSEKSPLYTVSLIPGTLREDFFVIPEHRERFTELSRSRPADWKVTSVEADVRDGEVMCASVPEGHMFTLEDNLLTHNCGGFCVRAGQAQFRLLLQQNRDRYLFHEGKEQELREYLGKDVTILKEVVNGQPVPLSLTSFRERQDRQPGLFDFDEFDFGGCGCFVQEEA